MTGKIARLPHELRHLKLAIGEGWGRWSVGPASAKARRGEASERGERGEVLWDGLRLFGTVWYGSGTV